MDKQTQKAIASVELQADMRAVFAEFAELGIIVDSGQQRPNRFGDLETVYVLAPDGKERFKAAYGREPSLSRPTFPTSFTGIVDGEA